jgi:catalase
MMPSLGAAAQTPRPAPVDTNVFFDQFEASFGKFEAYRRSGTKGICATGEFVGTAQARCLSTSSAFSGRPVPVVVRFSVGGANPKAPDNAKSERNLALQLELPNGERWQMGNFSAPVFGASSPQQFFGRLKSLQPDPASFGAVNDWGVHAFALVNTSGRRQFGRWVFEPVAGVQGLSYEAARAHGPVFLFDDLRQRVKAGEEAYRFKLELAEDGGGPCLSITFNPRVLPRGVEPSDDPMIAARAAPYGVGLARRLSEGGKQQ